MSDVVQRWTTRAKLLMKLGRSVGVPNDLKSQYLDFIKQGNLDQIENVEDPTQSTLFRHLSAALRKQVPVAELPNVLQQGDEPEEQEVATINSTPAHTATHSQKATEAPPSVETNPAEAPTAASTANSTIEKELPANASHQQASSTPVNPSALRQETATQEISVTNANNKTNDAEDQNDSHDLPLDEETSTPRKKRTKISMDALADWQQALCDKVTAWTQTNFTLVESIDDITLMDDPSLFVVEEQDSGLTNSPLFRILLRASSEKKPVRLAWALAGLDVLLKVTQAITSKVKFFVINTFL